MTIEMPLHKALCHRSPDFLASEKEKRPARILEMVSKSIIKIKVQPRDSFTTKAS